MGSTTVGGRKIRVEVDRAVEQAQCVVVRLAACKLIKPTQTAQIEGIGVETLGRLALGTLDLGVFYRWRDRPDHALGHLVLQIEDVADPSIKPVCPKMCPGGGIDELSRDAHPVCRFANAAFQHVAHPKLAPDLLHIDDAPLVCETRVAGDDKQGLEMRQRRDDVLGYPVGKIFLFRIGAQIGEGEMAIEGLSGSVSAGFGGCSEFSAATAVADPSASRTAPTKRKP